MFRIILYIFIALLAFSIGSYFVYLYVQQNVGIDSISEKVEQRPLLDKTVKRPAAKQPRKKEYISDKEKALLLFEPTLKHWLKEQKVNPLTKHSDKTKEKILASNLNVIDERDLLNTIKKDFKSFLIDVNGDSEKELAILCNYSPPEHYELWIFKKTEKDFEVILSTYNDVEEFRLQKSKTKGFFDLETTASYPRSKTSLGMDIFEFDGEQYVKMKCYDYIYLYEDKNGDLQKLKKPKYVSLHCC